MENEKIKSLIKDMYPYLFNDIDKDKQEELLILLERGFTPYFSYYGENNTLHPLISWYGFYGKNKNETINLVICTGKEYTVYKNNKKIGSFVSLNDIFNLFDLNSYSSIMPKIYSDYLLFNEGKLGRILKKAKTLMDDDKWNEMVEFAASAQWNNSLGKYNTTVEEEKEISFSQFKEFEKAVQEQKQLFDAFAYPPLQKENTEISEN